ncbi:MAG: hypothetical protein A2Y25_09630 [Candidatus Melainabacteria bacterium GWF2_37_15]|nr:MAG: hypothetical protein A2Y25_09630 [Candidatus Melainabacteria bacterium GWF2_37_15]
MHKEEKVNFDPGFYKFSLKFPDEIPHILEELAKLKQPHQKKFEFQKLEAQVVPMIKTCAALYLGCILWGCYLYYKYKDNTKEIQDNPAKEADINPVFKEEIDFILANLEKLDKASVYYLNRPFRIDKRMIDYFKDYREFVELNNSFRELDTTADIKIPASFAYFKDYTPEKLDELKQKIDEIIETGRVEKILELGP